jgi:hypothetical protein
MKPINEALFIQASVGGICLLYDAHRTLINVGHSSDVRQFLLGLWDRFSNPLRATEYFDFVPYDDERTR